MVSKAEGQLLFNLAKECTGKGVIVEIGSWKGESTICLAKGSKEGNKIPVYSIDPHTGSPEHKKSFKKVWTFDEFKKNITNAGVDDIIISIVKTSEEAAKKFKKPIELIFIDGAHEYNMVKLDFELYYPKVVENGIMAFHDTTGWPGPKKFVEKYVYLSKNFKDVKIFDSITYAKKVRQNCLKDRIRNRYVLLLKKISEILGTFKLPKSLVFIGSKILRSIH